MTVDRLDRNTLAYEWELTHEWELSHDCADGRRSPSCLDVWEHSTMLQDESTEPHILRSLD
jgi:hypothetical protein